MRSGYEVQKALDDAVQALDTITKGQDTALDAFVEAEEAWEDARDDFIAEQVEHYAKSSGRMPSDPKMEAAARKENREAYHNFTRAKRAMEKLNRRSGNLRSIVTGLQSELRTLTIEARAPASDGPSWSERAAVGA